MNLKEAREHVRGDLAAFYAEYKRLGGRLNKRDYERAAAHFLVYTFEIFVVGNPTKYPSRGAAINAYAGWLRHHDPAETVGRIFESQDNVHAYT